MKLNCKPGDLAVIVRDDDFPKNIGKFVHVVSAGNPEDFYGARPTDVIWACTPKQPLWVWANDERTKAEIYSGECSFDDFQLRPIRDQDGEDEMLRIAGLPNKEPANV